MTRIECSRCGETVEFTGTSVTLPFICNECAATPQTPDNPVGLKNVGKVNNPDGVVNALELLTDWASHGDTGLVEPAEETSILPHDEATIENTTLLIADLEEQVRAGKRVNDLSHALIVDMKEQLQVGSEMLVGRDATISKLNAQIQSREGYALTLNTLLQEYRQVYPLMKQEVRRLRLGMFRLAGLYQDVKRQAVRSSHIINDQSKTIFELRQGLSFLKNRGFIERLFNDQP